MAAIILMSRVNSAKVGYGDTYLLQAILVSVMGGIEPKGALGKVSGVFLGIVVLQVLQTSFTLFGFTPYIKQLVWDATLLLVMALSYVLLRRMETDGLVYVAHGAATLNPTSDQLRWVTDTISPSSRRSWRRMTRS